MSIAFSRIANSFCEGIDNGIEFIDKKLNPAGIALILAQVPLPCRTPSLPFTPVVVDLIFNDIFPNCIIKSFNLCKKDMKRIKLKDLWIIDNIIDKFEKIEDAEKYWSSIAFIPFAVIRGQDDKKQNIFMQFYLNHLFPSQQVRIDGIIMYRGDSFLLLFGPSGQEAPNLLSHYKHYSIKENEDGLFEIEPDNKPYYEVGNDDEKGDGSELWL